jgi:hypothetical protein
MQYGSKLGKRGKKRTGYFFSHCKRLPSLDHKENLQVGLMNQAPTTGKKVACPLFLESSPYNREKSSLSPFSSALDIITKVFKI